MWLEATKLNPTIQQMKKSNLAVATATMKELLIFYQQKELLRKFFQTVDKLSLESTALGA